MPIDQSFLTNPLAILSLPPNSSTSNVKQSVKLAPDDVKTIIRWVDYQAIDAFSPKAFGGNPAAVIVLDPEHGIDLTDEQKLILARELNLSETAFLTPIPRSPPNSFKLQWATPAAFVNLCGHATLGSTAALTQLPGFAGYDSFEFHTLSGKLVGKVVSEGVYELDFPDDVVVQVTDEELLRAYEEALERATGMVEGAKAIGFWQGREDLFIEVDPDTPVQLGDWQVDSHQLTRLPNVPRGVILTTTVPQPSITRFHSRAFFAEIGVQEDPVTGSAHCALAVLYTKKLGLEPGSEIWAVQGGERRGEIGVVWMKEEGRVLLRGQATKVSEGRIRVP